MWPFRFLLCALLVATLTAQVPERPRVFAVRDARIVPVSGPEIARGTIVLRDGLIASVGSGVEPPNGAWIIEGEGLTVYPGFIHGLSELGMPDGKKRPAIYGKRPASGPDDRPATSPWALGVHYFSAESDAVEKWRYGGFTTVAVAPRQGILPGQVSLLNLGRTPAGNAVAAEAAVLVQLPNERSRANGYPSSLFGQMAYVEQIFLDAHQARQAQTLYDKDPNGLERPAYDRAVNTLIDALRRDRPILYPGDTATEMRRAIERTETLSKSRTIYGARQGYRDGIAASLAKESVSVLVNLSWPETPDDPDPETEVALRVLRFRQNAPSSAKALAEAGVVFGFYASEAKQPTDVMEGLRKALEAGLSRPDALEALTLGAARIYGADDRLGSLTPGKIANLVIYRDDPFAEKSRPVTVFVDGEKFDVPPAEAKPEKEDDDS